MHDTIKRAVRTFFQGAVGVLALTAIGPLSDLVQDVVSGSGNDIQIDLNLWRNILLACVAGGVIALIAFIQNLIEDKVPKLDTR
jgi:hypothetical protein